MNNLNKIKEFSVYSYILILFTTPIILIGLLSLVFPLFGHILKPLFVITVILGGITFMVGINNKRGKK
ncbi:hypothetical protein GF336_00195 [Candidatus Woesearchaeota archaeon]|nr:hypothetical protein [Candidatus Woesearchaeota archaeon]